MIDLEPARLLLQADGGDIELIGLVDGTAYLRLIVTGSACAECVLPRPLLETVVLDLLKSGDPTLEAVSIDDPREPAVGPR